MKITGAIFDMDGTLMDSMDYWAIVPSEYLDLKGIEKKKDTNRLFTDMGMKWWYEYQEIPYPFEEVSSDIYMLMQKYYDKDIKLKDGVYDMLTRLKNAGVKMVLATATDREVVEKILKRLNIDKFFSAIFTSKEVGKGKRFPLIFEKALEFLGTDKETTYVFEDAIHAMKTCHANGFKIVGVYYKNVWESEESIKALCNYYLDKHSKYQFEVQ
jgi:HAD superfamily hydrolase (TIGR01509 family)